MLIARWVAWAGPADREFSTLLARQDGDQVALDGQWSLGGNDGRRFRWSFSDLATDRFRWQGHHSSDGGQTWRVVEEMQAKRTSGGT